MTTTVTYTSIDGARKTLKTDDLAKAHEFATKWVGKSADVGSYYAVSSDGIGRVTVEGDHTLREVISGKAAVATKPFTVQVATVNEDEGTTHWSHYGDAADLDEAAQLCGAADEAGHDGSRVLGNTPEAKAQLDAQRAKYYAAMDADDFIPF